MKIVTTAISQHHTSFHQPIQVPLPKCQAAEARLERECDHSSSDCVHQGQWHRTQWWVCFLLGFFWCQWMRASLLHSLKPSFQGTDRGKSTPSHLLVFSQHHSKGSMGHSGDFGIIPANHLSSCKHCLEMHRLQGNKYQQLVFNQFLQVQFLHSFILFTTMVSQLKCF